MEPSKRLSERIQEVIDDWGRYPDSDSPHILVEKWILEEWSRAARLMEEGLDELFEARVMAVLEKARLNRVISGAEK